MKHWWFITLILLVVVLGACGGRKPSPTPEASQTPEPTEAAPTMSPMKTPDSPLPSPTAPAVWQETGTVADIIVPQLMEKEDLALDPGNLKLMSVEEVTWNDTSLGCPQPGMMYAQVLIPGWRVIVEDAEGNRYDVHAPEDLKEIVVCASLTEPGRPVPAIPEGNPAVEAARRWLAEREELPLDAVSVLEVEGVQWRNSCLGCAGAQEVCLTVITPGYRVVLQAEDESYTLHTDTTGASIRLCDSAKGAPGD
jgi:hypothetical protein